MTDTATVLELLRVNTRMDELRTANQMLMNQIGSLEKNRDHWMNVALEQQKKLDALRERDLKAELNKEAG